MKKWIIGLFTFLFGFVLFGCSSPNYDNPTIENGGVNEGENNVVIETTRKIIYTVDYSIYGENSFDTKKEIYNKLDDFNGYTSSSNESLTYASVVYKIPTENLNSFLDFVDSFDGVGSKTISSNDITSSYSYMEAKITTLEASKNAYLTLLNDPSLTRSDIILINDKIDEIDIELLSLYNQKANYDNKLDYSTITINYHLEQKPSFFKEYVAYLGNFFVGLGKAILYMLPVFFVTGCIFSLIFFPIRYRKNKKH